MHYTYLHHSTLYSAILDSDWPEGVHYLFSFRKNQYTFWSYTAGERNREFYDRNFQYGYIDYIVLQIIHNINLNYKSSKCIAVYERGQLTFPTIQVYLESS